MSLISSLAEVGIYTLAWVAISTGAALFIAAAFFGIKEKNLEKNQHDL